MNWRIPEDYILRCYAGWLGKVIGVRHGAPIEGWTYEKINRRIGEITDYLVDYRDFAADDDTTGPRCFARALGERRTFWPIMMRMAMVIGVTAWSTSSLTGDMTVMEETAISFPTAR